MAEINRRLLAYERANVVSQLAQFEVTKHFSESQIRQLFTDYLELIDRADTTKRLADLDRSSLLAVNAELQEQLDHRNRQFNRVTSCR